MLNIAIRSKVLYGLISSKGFVSVTQTPANILSKNLYRNFGFFGGKRSTKLGEKCCKYGQNGKALTQQTALGIYNSLEVKAWEFNQDHTRLYRYYYCQDYLNQIKFVNEVVGVDMKTSQNKPEFAISDKGYVKVELISHEIKGLSRKDFELATCIDMMNLDSQSVLPSSQETPFESIPENSEDIKYYYTKEYADVINFLNAIVKLSNDPDFDVTPQFEVRKSDLQKVHLKGGQEKGLWEKIQNNIEFDDHAVIPIKNFRKYRSEARMVIKSMEDEEIQKQLSADFMSKANKVNQN